MEKHGKTGKIKGKTQKTWGNMENHGKTENTGKRGESKNIEKHGKTGRIRGKHRKTRKRRENQVKT